MTGLDKFKQTVNIGDLVVFNHTGNDMRIGFVKKIVKAHYDQYTIDVIDPFDSAKQNKIVIRGIRNRIAYLVIKIENKNILQDLIKVN